MGALVAGTDDQFEQEKGSLYMLRKDKTVNKSLTKIGISNGLAWSSDKTKFYYIDSLKYRVDSYDYDNSTGALCKSLYIESKKYWNSSMYFKWNGDVNIIPSQNQL